MADFKLIRSGESHLQMIEKQWKELLKSLNSQFDGDLDLQAVLFLIGVQELGKGKVKYSKDQKLELMYIIYKSNMFIYFKYILQILTYIASI